MLISISICSHPSIVSEFSIVSSVSVKMVFSFTAEGDPAKEFTPIVPPSSTAQARLENLLNTIQPPTSRYGRPLPGCWVPIQEQPLRHPRKLRMVTIGGGISAMNLAFVIQHEKKMDEMVEQCIYEANDTLGGTWFVNRYPGVACDVPAHIYTCKHAKTPPYEEFS